MQDFIHAAVINRNLRFHEVLLHTLALDDS